MSELNIASELLYSILMSRSELLTRMPDHVSSEWVAWLEFEQTRTTDDRDNAWHVQLVSLWCLKWSEPLTEHSISSKWVLLSVWADIRTTDKNGWMPIQFVSCFLVVFEEQNHWWEWTWTWIQFVSCPSNIEWMMWISHWWEWLHMHSASEFLSIFQQIRSFRTTDKNGWMFVQDVSCSPVFLQIRLTDKNGWTCVQLVSHFPLIDQNYWWENI